MGMAADDTCGNTKVEMMKKCINGYMNRLQRLPRRFWKVGKEDPRRVIHAFKVGLALTLVSLLYLIQPLFNGIGKNAIWAVMTVVVVLEFTAGATLCKGLNRGFGTLLAGSLSFLLEYLARTSGQVFCAIFIGSAVFVIGMAATYLRFFPYIKKNYDYGVVIFLLTFNLITASSYRLDHVLRIAGERLYTIAIGCGVCLVMSVLVFPNWSGEDLHNSTVSKLEALATSIEACVDAYFCDEDPDVIKGKASEDPIFKGYKTVLDSRSNDETLALHASWEPRHSRYCYRFPWQQYVKLGVVLRHFGYTVEALHGCLQTEIQTPQSVRALFKDPCMRLAGEVSKVLMQLAEGMRRRCCCSPQILSDQLQEALKDLNSALKSQPRLFLGRNTSHSGNMLALTPAANRQRSPRESKEGEPRLLRPSLSKIAITSLEFSEALPFAAFASLLVETVARLDLVIEEVEKLGEIAGFKGLNPGDEIVLTFDKPKIQTTGNIESNLPSHVAE